MLSSNNSFLQMAIVPTSCRRAWHHCLRLTSALFVAPWTMVLLLVVQTADTAESESPYNPPIEIDVRDGFVLNRVNLTERKIPALVLSKSDPKASKKPLVIALHGGGMPEILDAPGMTAKEAWFDREEFHDAPYTLAEAGCMVVIFDAWWAGERFRPEYRQLVRDNIANAVVRGWVETARDVNLVIDALAERPDVDINRVGLCGRSGGAITALMAAHRDSRVVAVTSWAGCADVKAFLYGKAPVDVVDGLIEAAPEVRKLLQEFDPIYNLDAMVPRAILLMNNRADPAVPLALAAAFHKKLKPAYVDHAARLKLRILDAPEPTHKMTPQDYEVGCTWLVTHLKQ